MKIIAIGEGTSGISSPALMVRVVARRWQRRMTNLFDPYRHERHYMRGPGPKCQEKGGP
jgi:hypothetical protein